MYLLRHDRPILLRRGNVRVCALFGRTTPDPAERGLVPIIGLRLDGLTRRGVTA